MIKYKDKVKIKNGFYKNCSGTVVELIEGEYISGCRGHVGRKMENTYAVKLKDGKIIKELDREDFIKI